MDAFVEKAQTASFVLPKDIIKQIDAMAHAKQTSKSALVREALEIGLEQLQRKGKKRG